MNLVNSTGNKVRYSFIFIGGIIFFVVALFSVNWSFLRSYNLAPIPEGSDITPSDVNPDSVSSGDGVVFFSDKAVETIRKNGERNPQIKQWLQMQFEIARASHNRAPRPVKSLAELKSNLDLSASAQVEDEFNRLIALALDARMNGNKDSLKTAREYLLAWAGVYEPNGYPNVEVAMSGYIMAYELARKNLSGEDRATIDNFLDKLFIAQKENVNRPDFDGQKWGNKWSLHASNVAMVAFLERDREKIAYVKNIYFDQLSHNIQPAGKLADFYPKELLGNVFERFPFLKDRTYEKGVTFDFIHRDALLYHRASIEPLYVIALIAKNNGEDWYLLKGEKGQTLEWAFDFLVPYATGEEEHYEFKDTLIDFDTSNKRQTWFKPQDGISTLTLATGLYPKYKQYANINLLWSSNMPVFVTYEQ
ncbi:alginate lyase family protein [Candidatus Wolfebacteria bacterium]|nr:alginate lyase family protein [Candidatus Wolfebacteria bacterium]